MNGKTDVLSKKKCRAVLVGKYGKLTSVCDGKIDLSEKFYRIESETGKYFSVFSLDEESSGVTILNAKYEVNDIVMTNDYPLGVSNEYPVSSDKKYPVITVEKGTLIVFYDITD